MANNDTRIHVLGTMESDMLTGSYFVDFDLECSYIVTISARQHTGKFSICAIEKEG